MNIPLRANVAHVVALIVSRRTTRPDELPDLVRNVQLALMQLDETAKPVPVADWRDSASDAAPVAPRAPRRRRTLAAEPAEIEPETIAPAPAPRLLRRADVIPAHVPNEHPAVLAAVPGGALRGVVKWFDLRLRRGALRLPGVSGDVTVEPALLDEMAIPRLYKGQEIEATLTGEPPRVQRLALPGGAWQVSSVGGVVHSRHAKTVVVELKREALRRVGARAEAELLLGPSRAR
jgi:hypothetical protein